MTLSSKQWLTPHMLRLRFVSAELAGFTSAAPDDHIKLFVPDGAGETSMRDYTPRAFDPEAGTLTVDFAVHEAGPATRWALTAEPGDAVQIGGPRGSLVVADDFDWYLLVGDETAIPAISRRIEEVREDAKITAFILVDDEADCVLDVSRPGLALTWLKRSGRAGQDARLLRQAVEALSFPEGDGYVWIAAEARAARALKTLVIDERGHPPEWTKSSGYWSENDDDGESAGA